MKLYPQYEQWIEDRDKERPECPTRKELRRVGHKRKIRFYGNQLTSFPSVYATKKSNATNDKANFEFNDVILLGGIVNGPQSFYGPNIEGTSIKFKQKILLLYSSATDAIKFSERGILKGRFTFLVAKPYHTYFQFLEE